MWESDRKGGGIGFWGLLLLLFIGLKVAGVINWSWWWVLSPMWISAAIIILLTIWFILMQGRK